MMKKKDFSLKFWETFLVNHQDCFIESWSEDYSQWILSSKQFHSKRLGWLFLSFVSLYASPKIPIVKRITHKRMTYKRILVLSVNVLFLLEHSLGMFSINKTNNIMFCSIGSISSQQNSVPAFDTQRFYHDVRVFTDLNEFFL